MFSWSKHSKYPAQRLSQQPTTTTTNNNNNNNNNHAPIVAQAVQGSIRPPTAFANDNSNNNNTSYYTRQQHLDSYLNDDTLKRSTRQVVVGIDSTYDTVFQTTQGNALILRVHLPPSSPPPSNQQRRPPVMTLVGIRATHPWLDSKMQVVGYPQIMSEPSWAGCSLGTSVHQIVQHFQLNPPAVLEIRDEGLRKLQSTLPQPPNDTANPPPNYGSTFSADSVQLPRVPLQFQELDDMTRPELEALLNDETQFLNFVKTLDIFHQLQSKRTTVLDKNEKMAMTNLEKEQEYLALYQETSELQATYQPKFAAFKALLDEQEQLSAPPDSRSILKRLHKAKREAMDKSDQYAAEFIDGDSGDDVRTFSKNFLEQRHIFHIRAAKEERLKNGNGGLVR